LKIEVTSSSKSKKGTVWLQVKVLDMEGAPVPIPGEIFNCSHPYPFYDEKENSDGQSK
jgi:hypothetical protein